ncbi:hypothetical protein ILUMI_20540 [Ignelater luminosus]|uniref:DDE-1 domain-containing protein n=1 Tax=Ignelater luminosus TaxID=2038154 RepID=A0A8K0CDZ1_IGNLU|nr:hypothetical protein ILUMI_20540 [Ignelater luminosus]
MVGKVVSAERDQLVTGLCYEYCRTLHSTGFNFSRKRMKQALTNGAPAKAKAFSSDIGYINSATLLEWLAHFVHHVRPIAADPVLLILDNHSHVSIEVVNYCHQHNLHVAEILSTAFQQIATMQVCGIWPLNPNVFSDEDFLSSSVTNQLEEAHRDRVVDTPTTPINRPNMSNGVSCATPVRPDLLGNDSDDELSTVPSSKTTPWVSPADILPFPKMTQCRKRRTANKRSEIISSSAYKATFQELEKVSRPLQ